MVAASVPFLSVMPSRTRGEWKGNESVLDKSVIDFSVIALSLFNCVAFANVDLACVGFSDTGSFCVGGSDIFA